MNILIVDDNSTNRKLLRVTLEAEGFTTVEAGDGVEALEALGQQNVEAIISDILMPRMDGFRLCQEVRKNERYRHLPFLIYSATYTSPGDARLALNSGADRYLRKPCPVQEMVAAIREVVDAARRRCPLPASPAQETQIMREYNEALVRKLEDRNNELQQQREWLRVTLSSIGDAVLAADTGGRVTFLNPAAEALTGWEESRALGQPLEDVFRIMIEKTRQPAEDIVAQALRSGRVVSLANHTVLVNREGREIPIEDSAAPINDATGKTTGVVLVFHDVTERKRAEQELRNSEERFRAFFELAAAGAAEVEPSAGQFTRVNARFCEITGYSREELLKMSQLDCTHPEDRTVHRQWHEKLVRGEVNAYSLEERCLRKDGRVIWVELAFALVRDAAGQPLRKIEVALDITSQKEFQAELERLVAERTARLQELVGDLEHFSYTLVHDMRAPLRTMRSFGDLISETCAGCEKPEPQDYLQRIMNSAGRMDGLITDALSFTKAVRQELPLEPIDIAALLRGMLDTYPELQPSRADIRVVGQIPRVMGNEAGLTQCLSNLLGNAVKFVKPGQIPRVRIRAETVHRQEAKLQQPAQYVRLWFEDEGIGIPAKAVDRVFDMFHRAHKNYEGTGIGLALVRKVAQRMGGRVGVESVEGQGSKFWIELAVCHGIMTGADGVVG